MRIPEPGPLGETFFDASVRAIVPGSLLNSPSGGCVESVLTLLDHFSAGFIISLSHHHAQPGGTGSSIKIGPLTHVYEFRLKYCTSRSCCLACSSVLNVPRLRRLPVAGSFLREYRRNCPDFSFRIIRECRCVRLRFCRPHTPRPWKPASAGENAHHRVRRHQFSAWNNQNERLHRFIFQCCEAGTSGYAGPWGPPFSEEGSGISGGKPCANKIFLASPCHTY